jgi:hypothetical protein
MTTQPWNNCWTKPRGYTFTSTITHNSTSTHVSRTNTCGERSQMSKIIPSLHLTASRNYPRHHSSPKFIEFNEYQYQCIHIWVLPHPSLELKQEKKKRDHLHKKNLLSYKACRNKPKIQTKKHWKHMHVKGVKPTRDILESLKKLGPLQTENLSMGKHSHAIFLIPYWNWHPLLWHNYSTQIQHSTIYFHHQTTFQVPLSSVILTHCWTLFKSWTVK